MNWLREIRSVFVIAPIICTLGCVWFLFHARAVWNDASARFDEATTELSRLEQLAPYPSAENLRQMTLDANAYEAAVTRLKDKLQMRVLPLPHLAPNEFQSRLREATIAVEGTARAQGVNLPDEFHLGFDEFAAALPNEAAAPLLGQELAQIEWILNVLVEARVESLISFRRTPLAEEHGSAVVVTSPIPAGRKPETSASAIRKVLERNVVEATFVSTPAAARKVLNQIAGANEQFFIIRHLQIRNEKDKGPQREVGADQMGNTRGAGPPVPSRQTGTKSPAGAALNFIVGNERIETCAEVEIVRFLF